MPLTCEVAEVAEVADTPGTNGQCTVCGEPLDQALIDAGLTDHGENDDVPTYPASLKDAIREQRRALFADHDESK